jgi:DNA (cytosine-5)-methyltransferase 1
MKLKFIDLFAGVGGIRLGMEKGAKGECVFSSEWDKHCQATYEKNFGEKPAGDITQVKTEQIPDHDILCGGFPCQAFSVAGKRAGFEDTRGTLFFEIARILKDKKPKAFLLENVKGLLNHDQGKTFEVILATLKELGYTVHYKVLDSMSYGNIPQTRERIFLVGFRNDVKQKDKFQFPKETPLKVKFRDLISEEKQEPNFYYNKSYLYPILKKAMKNKNTVYQWRRKYVRENKSNACPTLTANMGTGGHNVPLILDDYGIRKLTPRECARFQGFPDSYKIIASNAQAYKQFGNSVTVSVIERVAREIAKILQNK